jgi:hypothetical protein
MITDAEVTAAYSDMGAWDDLSENCERILEGLFCKMYGSKDSTDINHVRYNHFLSSYSSQNSFIDCNVGKDISLLPPCRRVLKEHVKRSNYQCRIWTQLNQQYPVLQDHTFHGFRRDNDLIVPNWYSGDMVPKDILHLIRKQFS